MKGSVAHRPPCRPTPEDFDPPNGAWGSSFTDEQFKLKTVHDSEHKEHKKFLSELNKVKDLPNIVHNFSHLTKNKKQII